MKYRHKAIAWNATQDNANDIFMISLLATRALNVGILYKLRKKLT